MLLKWHKSKFKVLYANFFSFFFFRLLGVARLPLLLIVVCSYFLLFSHCNSMYMYECTYKIDGVQLLQKHFQKRNQIYRHMHTKIYLFELDKKKDVRITTKQLYRCTLNKNNNDNERHKVFREKRKKEKKHFFCSKVYTAHKTKKKFFYNNDKETDSAV